MLGPFLANLKQFSQKLDKKAKIWDFWHFGSKILVQCPENSLKSIMVGKDLIGGPRLEKIGKILLLRAF